MKITDKERLNFLLSACTEIAYNEGMNWERFTRGEIDRKIRAELAAIRASKPRRGRGM